MASTGPDNPDDNKQTLIRQARDGDEQARSELFKLCSPTLEIYLRKRMGPSLRRFASLSDVCMETFGRLFRSLHVLPEEASLDDVQGILFRNANWTLADQGRKAAKFRGESAGGATGIEDQPIGELDAGTVTRDDEMDWIRLQIHRLSENQAQVVERRLGGMSFEAIAENLGIAKDTCRKRYLRASLRLKKLIGSESDA